MESALYFTASEALANVVKHAEASAVTIAVSETDAAFELAVADDGRGGADAEAGSGLRGLADRVGALGGGLRVESPAGVGTRLTVRIPR